MNAELTPHPQLSGRGLRLAQIVWIILVGMTLVMSAVGGVVHFQQSLQVCEGTRLECHDRSLATPEDVAQLQADGMSLTGWVLANTLYVALIASVYCVIAFLIFVRKRGEWSGLLFSYFLISTGTLSGNSPALAAQYPIFTIPAQFIQFMGYWMLPIFFSTFPTGRMVPRFMRGVCLFLGLAYLAQTYINLIPRSSPLLEPFAAFLWLGMFLSGLGAQIYRYRRVSTPREREQTKWVLFGIAVMIVSLITVYFSDLGNQFGTNAIYSHHSLMLLVGVNLLIMLIPISLGIAILRAKLFDIDLIIRRTLVYSIFTALLALIYFGGVVLLQQLTRSITASSDIAIVVSTLIIAALFFPLRRRVQTTIDRRFYRRKYDAAKTLAAFGATVRDEVELDKLTGELINVVSETMQPSSVSVWLKEANRKR